MVRRADHVEVQVQGDVLDFLFGQVVDVGGGSDQAELLGAPPCEPHRVGRLDLGHLDGNLQDGAAARSVVLDPGSGLDRVQVSAGHHDVAVVLAGKLSEHVVVDAGLVRIHVDERLGARLRERNSLREARTHQRSRQVAGRAVRER